MQVKYLIRLDDACPTMKKEMWDRIEALLDSYGIKPMVGIIPDNADKDLKIDEEDTFFWEKARQWQSKKWSIALHGYDHCYILDDKEEIKKACTAYSPINHLKLNVFTN